MRGSHSGKMVFRNIEAPAGNVLGTVNGGAKVSMSGLDCERAVLAAGPIGVMQAAMDNVVPHIHDRKQFGQSNQVFGGNGYIDEYALGRLWRDARL